MKPGDKFSILNIDKTSFDEVSFAKLYLPILGKTAFTLYQLFRVRSNGKFSMLMEYLNVGQLQLEQALDKLRALSLLRIFDNSKEYQFLLRSPRSFEDFMLDDLLVQLLIQKLGAERVRELEIPDTTTIQAKELIVRFSDVFLTELDPEGLSASSNNPQENNLLDLTSFKSLMAQRKVSFMDENKDILHLYSMAEKFGLDWYQLFKLTEETLNADRTLNSAAMIRRQISKANNDKKPELETRDEELAKSAKQANPSNFLTQLKRQIGGFVTSGENDLLANFTKQKMQPEVQNILIHYSLVQKKNPSLTAAFVNRIANDLMRADVTTAEAAISHIRDFEKRSQEAQEKRASGRKKQVKAEPTWSNPVYQEKATDEELASFKKELEALGNSNSSQKKN